MKILVSLGVLIFMFTSFSCTESEELTPSAIDGLWAPTYQVQSKTLNGSYGKWQVINTFVALPNLEFKSNGEFLRDGKPGADACRTSGNKFKVEKNQILFSEFSDSNITAACPACAGWKFEQIGADTLILDECFSVRSKYVRVKTKIN
jgi:hypothetical protein